MTNEEALMLFERAGALLAGHFKLSSGLHSGTYVQCAVALQHPRYAEQLGRAGDVAVGLRQRLADLGGVTLDRTDRNCLRPPAELAKRVVVGTVDADTGRSPGRDHAPELSLRLHDSRRC